MDNKLLQNNLASATTEQGFPTKTGLALQREVTLEDGQTVIVEGITAEALAKALEIHYITPGEKYMDNGNNLNGVVQHFNGDSGDIISEAYNLILPDTLYSQNTLSFDKANDEEMYNELASVLLDENGVKSDIKLNLVQGDTKIELNGNALYSAEIPEGFEPILFNRIDNGTEVFVIERIDNGTEYPIFSCSFNEAELPELHFEQPLIS